MNYADMAAHLVFGDRNADYGDPREDFSGVAQMWSGLLNAKLRQGITPEDVAMMMVCLKLRRQAHRPKIDNIVDAHGYLMTLEWITTGEKPLPKYMEQEGGSSFT
jgi:hypothetical protein